MAIEVTSDHSKKSVQRKVVNLIKTLKTYLVKIEILISP